MQVKSFLWLSRIFGVASSLGVIYLCVDILRRGESPWLLPAIIGGSALFLSVPSSLLLIWGSQILKKAALDQRSQVKTSLGFSAAPIIIVAISFVLGCFIVFLSPPGMAGGNR